MQPSSQETLTFVVRLWRETGAARADGHAHWRGRVEHVGTQEVGYVEDVAGVTDLIERWTKLNEDLLRQAAENAQTAHGVEVTPELAGR